MMDAPYTIYTLHCSFPDRPPIHYTGITTPRGLWPRVIAHMHGYGSKFTMRQYDRGGSWHLVKLEGADNKNREWQVKAEWQAHYMCPLCQVKHDPPHTRSQFAFEWTPYRFDPRP